MRLQRHNFAVYAVLLLSIALPAQAADTKNFRLTIDLDAADGEISSTLRVELEREIFVVLKQQRCFSEVRGTPPDSIEDTDLGLVIRVDDYRERTSFDSSVHGAAIRDRVEPVPSTTRISGNVTLRLVTLSDDLELGRKRAVRQVNWRPPAAQDTLYQGRLSWIENVGQMARKFACRGGTTKLTRQIEKRRRE